jgi:hypothetical protein
MVYIKLQRTWITWDLRFVMAYGSSSSASYFSSPSVFPVLSRWSKDFRVIASFHQLSWLPYTFHLFTLNLHVSHYPYWFPRESHASCPSPYSKTLFPHVRFTFDPEDPIHLVLSKLSKPLQYHTLSYSGSQRSSLCSTFLFSLLLQWVMGICDL